MTFELQLMNWIQNYLTNQLLDKIMQFFTYIGDFGVVWIILTIILLSLKKTRTIGISLLIAMLLMLVVNNGILKNLIARSRPCQINQTVQLLIHCPDSFSFPSGHTSSSFAAMGVIWLSKGVKPSLKWSVSFVALMISISRVYLYVHFPSDIMVGAIVGWLISWLTVHFITPQILKIEKINQSIL